MKSNYKQLGQYIQQVDVRNKDLSIQNLLGVSIEKKFIPSIANIVGTDLSNYKIVRKGQFAYGPVTSRNGEKISIAYLDGDDCIISSSYTVFEVVNKGELYPEYLMLWFSRQEFDRYARYKSHGSVREIFDWGELCMVELPVPDIDKQKNIVKAYKAINDRIEIKNKINRYLEAMAQTIYCITYETNADKYDVSTLEETSVIRTGKLNSEDAITDGKYPFFTCSKETYMINTFAFEQEAVLLAGNNASAVYPLKLYRGKFNAYQRTYVISSKNKLVSNKQIYFLLKQQLNNFKGISSGTATKFLTMKILNPIPVVIAPAEVAQKYSKVTDIIFDEIYRNQNEIKYLMELQMIILCRISSR